MSKDIIFSSRNNSCPLVFLLSKTFFSLTFVLSQFVVTLCREPYFLKCISLPLPYMYVFLAFFSVNVVSSLVKLFKLLVKIGEFWKKLKKKKVTMMMIKKQTTTTV